MIKKRNNRKKKLKNKKLKIREKLGSSNNSIFTSQVKEVLKI